MNSSIKMLINVFIEFLEHFLDLPNLFHRFRLDSDRLESV